jgi:hypothetical protein
MTATNRLYSTAILTDTALSAPSNYPFLDLLPQCSLYMPHRDQLSTKLISGYNVSSFYGTPRPLARYHAMSVQQTIQLNAQLNAEAQSTINAKEPRVNIWEIDQLAASMSNLSVASSAKTDEKKGLYPDEKRQSVAPSISSANDKNVKASRFSGLKKALAIKSPEEKAMIKTEKLSSKARELRNAILEEERGRWPDEEWRQIVAVYQEKVGMTKKIADLRVRHPTQYLHLLRAGYFEPIPVAWATMNSNPLKFSIEAAAGWRGITPTWRGYEDTAEERLYWVLNHREGSGGMRLKPDIISAMNMARARMASAVEPPPICKHEVLHFLILFESVMLELVNKSHRLPENQRFHTLEDQVLILYRLLSR